MDKLRSLSLSKLYECSLTEVFYVCLRLYKCSIAEVFYLCLMLSVLIALQL